MTLPPEAQSLLAALLPAFTEPTGRRFLTLLLAATLTTGRRTVADLLRTLRHLAPGDISSYRRVLSRAPWSGLELGLALAAYLLRLLPDGPVVLVIDDTVDGHKGKHVHGKARHRDPVRSSHTYTAWRYGHRWVVLAVLVRFPFAARPWALPILVDLYRSEADNAARKRPHRTPARLACRLLRLVLLRFPGREFVFAGDGAYGTHEVARFCRRHAPRLTPVSKFHPRACLHEPAPPYSGHGRPRQKGDALPKPADAAARSAPARRTVAWYGGGTRQVGLVWGTGHWHKSGRGLVPVRWVFVRDLGGTHRDEYFFTTDPGRAPEWVVEQYCGRWNIETTFEEMRSYLGLETTRGWCERTVLRAAPCLFGLYSVVAALYQALPESKRTGRVEWPGKGTVTSSDALTSVRRWLWSEAVLPQAGGGGLMQELPEEVRELLLAALAPAA